MSRRVLAVLRRLSPWMRSVIVAAVLLVALGVAAAVSTPSSPQRQPTSRQLTELERTRPRAQMTPRPPVLARADLARARRTAVRFLASYLRFAYGQGPARSVSPVSSPVRGQLARGGASVTPAERRRRPRVVSLQVVAVRAGVARASALVADGGVSSYAVRLTLRSGRFGWVVSAISG